MFLGRFEQAPGCLNVLDVGGEAAAPEWVVRAVNVAAGDLVHRSTRLTQMEQYWERVRASRRAAGSRLAERLGRRRGAGSLPPLFGLRPAAGASRYVPPSPCRTSSFDTGWNAPFVNL